MSNLNLVMLMGYLGKDPEVLKDTQQIYFVRLNIATTKSYANPKGGDRLTETQWHTVYLSNGIAKYIAAKAKKGDKLLVHGELRTSEWQDKTKQLRHATAVYANQCTIEAQKNPKEVELEIEKPSERQEALQTIQQILATEASITQAQVACH